MQEYILPDEACLSVVALYARIQGPGTWDSAACVKYVCDRGRTDLADASRLPLHGTRLF